MILFNGPIVRVPRDNGWMQYTCRIGKRGTKLLLRHRLIDTAPPCTSLESALSENVASPVAPAHTTDTGAIEGKVNT